MVDEQVEIWEHLQPTFNPRVFDQLISRGLTKDSVVAISELIANSWDAGSTRVHITWPEDFPGEFSISDNGHGMTAAEFASRFTVIGYNRSHDQSSLIEVEGTSARRRVFGRNGIGRFAGFHFSQKFYVQTSSDGLSYTTFELSLNPKMQGFEVKEIPGYPPRFSTRGTMIFADVLEALPRTTAAIRKEIGVRFLTDPAFEVFLNGEKITFQDLTQEQLTTIESESSTGNRFNIVAFDASRSDRTTRQHGVAWHVDGKMVGVCGWSGPNGEPILDGRTSVAKRYSFIVLSDHLRESVLSDWTGFRADDEEYLSTFKAVDDAIIDFVESRSVAQRSYALEEIKQDNFHTLRMLSDKESRAWEAFVSETQKRCPSLTDAQLSQIASILANLQASSSQYALIEKLSHLSPDDLDGLNEILQTWTVSNAESVLDIIDGRLKLIEKMQTLVQDRSTLEVQQLQPLFDKCLWMFGTEYESVEFTSNQSMATVVDRLGEGGESASRLRPDFVIKDTGSVGFYSRPRFGDIDGEEIGIDRLIIVELKRPGIAISDAEKSQPLKYYRELQRASAIDQATMVSAFVLGSEVDQYASGKGSESDGRYTVQPLSYQTLLNRADQRMFKLRSRLQSAGVTTTTNT